MADKYYRVGEQRVIEVRIVPNRGDVDFGDLIVANPQQRIYRYKQSGGLDVLIDWVAASYNASKGVIVGSWNGALEKLASPGHYAMELRASVDAEVPRHLVTIDVEI